MSHKVKISSEDLSVEYDCDSKEISDAIVTAALRAAQEAFDNYIYHEEDE